jgi:hypothetical protein
MFIFILEVKMLYLSDTQLETIVGGGAGWLVITLPDATLAATLNNLVPAQAPTFV